MAIERGVFIAEGMASTDLVSLLRNGVQASELENGSVVKLGDLVVGENDLYNTEKIADATDEVYLVDGVELSADESTTQGLDDHVNVANKPVRLRKPVSGDRFSISSKMIDGAIEVGAIVEPAAGNKLAVADAPTDGATQFEVVDVDWLFGTRGIKMTRLVVK